MTQPVRSAKIIRVAEQKSVDRGGGARTIPLVNRGAGATSFINGITVIPPGSAIPLHYHNCDESVVVLQGKAVAEVDGVRHHLCAQDTSFIPAGIPHRFINETADEELRILWVYASLDANRTIVATGHTRTIDDEHTY